MTSYFDHFLLVKVIGFLLTDSIFILLSVIILYIVICYCSYLIPYRFQSLAEFIFNHWLSVILDNIGEKKGFFLFPILSMFVFILGINVLGFFLYTFPTTTHIIITFGVAIGIWLGVIILGFYKFRSLSLSCFMPSGAPLYLSPLLVIIEIASNISRPMALGMRLAANLTAGHILLSILSNFGVKLLLLSFGFLSLFPICIIIFMTILEVGVLIIQAYVFCLLSSIYLKDNIILH